MRKIPLMLAFIVSLQVAAYSFMLSGPFKVLDDQVSIVDNPDIKSFQNISKILGSSFFPGNSYYRPVVSLSYMLEYRFFDLNPFFYNLDNLILHILTTIILFFVIFLIFQSPWTGFWVACLFGIHPIHWEAVSNIAGRSILLCAFFTMSAFFLFLLFFRRKAVSALEENSIVYFLRNLFLYIFSLIFFSLGLLSKESAVMLPVILLSYVLLEGWGKKNFFRQVIVVVSFFMVVGIYTLVRLQLSMTHFSYWRSPAESVIGFLSFLRGVMTYLRVLVFPIDLHFDRMRYVFTSFLNPELIVTVGFFVMLITLVYKFRNKVSTPALFFLLWFFIELVPVSQLLVSIGVRPGYISLAEHFLYMPSVGIFVLIVLGGQWILNQNIKRQWNAFRGLIVIAAGFFIFLFLTNIQQNIYAASEGAMLHQTLEYDSHNTRIRNALALYYAQKNFFMEAEKEFRRSLENDPLDKIARIGLGKALCDQGRFWEGILEYERIPEFVQTDFLLRHNIDRTYTILIRNYEKFLEREPNNAQAYYSLGVIYSKQKKTVQAIEQFKKAVEFDPEYTNALFNLASSLEAVGELNEAERYYQKFLSLASPGDLLIPYVKEHLSFVSKKLP